MNYWEEGIVEALEDAKLPATKDQVDTIVAWVEGAFENYGMATGLDIASANFKSDDAIELARFKAEIEKKETRTLKTKPCKVCNTANTVKDEWDQNQLYLNCDGKGRV